MVGHGNVAIDVVRLTKNSQYFRGSDVHDDALGDPAADSPQDHSISSSGGHRRERKMPDLAMLREQYAAIPSGSPSRDRCYDGRPGR